MRIKSAETGTPLASTSRTTGLLFLCPGAVVLMSLNSFATLTNLAKPKYTLQSVLFMATQTHLPLAPAHSARPGVALMPLSDASEQPSRKMEASPKQTLLELVLLGCIFVRFVICSLKQEGLAMRKRSVSVHHSNKSKPCHCHFHCQCRHHQVQLNKNKQRVPFIKQLTILLLLTVLNYFPIPYYWLFCFTSMYEL